MRNYLIIDSKKTARYQKAWKFIEDLASFGDSSFAVIDIDFEQKNKLVLAKKGAINCTLMNHVDLDMIDYFVNIHLTKDKNLTEIILIENPSKMSSKETDYFKNNLKILNEENIYLIVCIEPNKKPSFVDDSFVIRAD